MIRECRRLCPVLGLTLLAAACGAPQPSPSPAAQVPPEESASQPQAIKSLPESAYKVEWGAIGVPATVTPGQEFEADVTFTNASTSAWPGGEGTAGLEYTVRFSSRWLKGKKVVVDYTGIRTELPQRVEPGQSVTLRPHFTAPGKPGHYKLQLELVHEAVTWFESRGNAPKLIDVEVKG